MLEIIESKTGRDVSGVSLFPTEMEVLFKPATKFQITKRYAWDSTKPRKNQENVTVKESWDPALDNEAAKYLDADLKDTILKMIIFKKEL